MISLYAKGQKGAKVDIEQNIKDLLSGQKVPARVVIDTSSDLNWLGG